MWRGIAAALAGYAALSFLQLMNRGGSPLRLGLSFGASLFIAAGVWMIGAAFAAEHFEGYLVLLGAIMVAHGLAAITYVAGNRRPI